MKSLCNIRKTNRNFMLYFFSSWQSLTILQATTSLSEHINIYTHAATLPVSLVSSLGKHGRCDNNCGAVQAAVIHS